MITEFPAAAGIMLESHKVEDKSKVDKKQLRSRNYNHSNSVCVLFSWSTQANPIAQILLSGTIEDMLRF